MKKEAAPVPPADLSLRQKITVEAAADLNGVSEATFRRHYRHLIRKVGLRRDVVTLGDAITLPPMTRPKKGRG